MRNHYITKLREENHRMKELIRIQALGMLAFIDGIEEDLLKAIQEGAIISYQIRGESVQPSPEDRGRG